MSLILNNWPQVFTTFSGLLILSALVVPSWFSLDRRCDDGEKMWFSPNFHPVCILSCILLVVAFCMKYILPEIYSE